MRTVIDSKAKHSLFGYLRDCIRHRELLYAFVYRQIKIKYSNTLLGVVWAVLQPLVYVFILQFVFQKVSTLPTDGVKPIAYTLVGLLVWIYFSNCLSNTTSQSLQSQELMSKVYFPRIYVPLAVLIEGLIDFGIVLIMALLVGGFEWGGHLLYLPIVFLHLFVFTFAVSNLISIATIRFPDVRFILGVVLRVFLFVTPIAYSTDVFASKGMDWIKLNPLVGLIEGLRFASHGIAIDMGFWMCNILFSAIVLLISMIVFVRFDRKMGDLL